jgi:hypothetical protein
MLATGRGADVARAMALPVFFGMFVELVSLFVVPVLYCGYMELKLNLASSGNPSVEPCGHKTCVLAVKVQTLAVGGVGLTGFRSRETAS